MKGFQLNIPPNAKRLHLTFGCQSSSLSSLTHPDISQHTFFKSLALFSPVSRWIAECRPLNRTILKRFFWPPVHSLISSFESSQSKGTFFCFILACICCHVTVYNLFLLLLPGILQCFCVAFFQNLWQFLRGKNLKGASALRRPSKERKCKVNQSWW